MLAGTCSHYALLFPKKAQGSWLRPGLFRHQAVFWIITLKPLGESSERKGKEDTALVIYLRWGSWA